MAYAYDSAVRAVEYVGPAQVVVRVYLAPSLGPFGVIARTVDFTGLVAGRWRHPNTFGLFAPSLLQAVFGLGNTPTRVRFGNPNFDYHVFAPAGQLREFSWPVPYRNTAPVDPKPLRPAATLWLPRT